MKSSLDDRFFERDDYTFFNHRGLSARVLKKVEMEIASRNAYYSINKLYKGFPRISGCPLIVAKKRVMYTGRNYLTGKTGMGIHKPPRSCHLRKIVNYPQARLGAYQVAVVGNKGTGKTNLINLLTAFALARRTQVLMFNDSCFEGRQLAAHGWFDKQLHFHPFQIDVWIPKGYKFKEVEAHNPIWLTRENVHERRYASVDDILDNMRHGRLSIVYDDCFDAPSKLRLLIDLFEGQKERMTRTSRMLFVHHELATLIPETARSKVWSLVQEFSDILVTSRRNMLGVLTAFHIPTEVFYRTTQKFGYTIFKRPTNRRNMSAVELASRKLSIMEANVSIAGYWMKHTIGFFPELPDIYRLMPDRTKWSYPELKPIEAPKTKEKNKIVIEDLDLKIIQMRSRKMSYNKIARELNLSNTTVWNRAKKLGVA